MKSFIALALLAQIAIVFCQRGYYEYHVPRPSIKSVYPRGFRMSIPHRPGVEKVTYHISLSGPLSNKEGGELSKGVVERWNGRWTFIDRTAQLQGGDTIYFWVEVLKDGKLYTYENGRYIVTGKTIFSVGVVKYKLNF